MPDNENRKLLRNLEDAGCDETMIKTFLQYQEKGKFRDQKWLLAQHKRILLEKVHENQHKIDCLDFLSYSMEQRDAFSSR